MSNDFIHYTDAEGKHRARRKVPVCDFCNTELPNGAGWTFFVKPGTEVVLTMHDVLTASDDDWAACSECKDDILSNRWGRIADRNVERTALQEGLTPRERAKAWHYCRNLHDEFKKVWDRDKEPRWESV